jgi:hypothetical protein
VRKKSLIEKLIKVSDLLDRRGQLDLADKIDSEIISELSNINNSEVEEIELLIPAEERKMLEEVMKSLQDSLS